MSQPPWETQVPQPQQQPGWGAPQQQPGGWNQDPYGQQPAPPQGPPPYGQGQPPPAPYYPPPPSQASQYPQGPQDPHNPMTVIPAPPQFSHSPYGQGLGGYDAPPPRRKRNGARTAGIVGTAVLLVAGVAIVAVIATKGKSDGSAPNSQAGSDVTRTTADPTSPAASSAPSAAASSSFPGNSYSSSAAPGAVGRPSDAGSGPATSTDPKTLDAAATDQTPFTADELVKRTFTDAKNVSYTLRGAGPHTCDKAGDAKVAKIVASSKCTNFMAASWTDKSGRIIVSAMVIPYGDAAAAKKIENQLGASASTGDYAQWCPPEGQPGSTVCARLTTAASREGKFGAFHRYVVVTTAVYTDLRHDDTQKDWLSTAADGAFQSTLPNASN